MDTLIVHIMIIVVTVLAFCILVHFVKKAPKDNLVVFMLIGCLLILSHILIFSIIRSITIIFHVDVNAGFFNWWSLFVRLQVPVTFLGIGILALLEKRNE